MIKVGITGKTGRVGTLLVNELSSGKWDTLSFSGGTTRKDDPHAVFKKSDIIIDFTLPEATEKHLDVAKNTNTALVIGTTGLSKSQEKLIMEASNHIPIVHAANMSVGVNLLSVLVEKAAAALDEDYDIEIMETHHKHKIDAPSGTALMLGHSAAAGRKKTLSDITSPARQTYEGARESGKIGFAVQRGGDIVGEHTVSFFGAGERIELAHKATDRSLFAKGALRAARWVHDKDAGLYTMRDVLEL